MKKRKIHVGNRIRVYYADGGLRAEVARVTRVERIKGIPVSVVFSVIRSGEVLVPGRVETQMLIPGAVRKLPVKKRAR